MQYLAKTSRIEFSIPFLRGMFFLALLQSGNKFVYTHTHTDTHAYPHNLVYIHTHFRGL